VALIARPLSADGSDCRWSARPSRPDICRDLDFRSDARPLRLAPGQRVDLPLAGRAVPVQVAGVWRDYARQTGGADDRSGRPTGG
jgi:putative ABC transport system permease protein